MRHIPVPDDGLQRLSKKKASATWLGAGDVFAVALVLEVSVLAADAKQSRPLAQECTGDSWASGWSRSTRMWIRPLRAWVIIAACSPTAVPRPSGFLLLAALYCASRTSPMPRSAPRGAVTPAQAFQGPPTPSTGRTTCRRRRWAGLRCPSQSCVFGRLDCRIGCVSGISLWKHLCFGSSACASCALHFRHSEVRSKALITQGGP